MFITLYSALQSLGVSNKVDGIDGDTYEGIIWKNGERLVSKKQVEDEIQRLKDEQNKNKYKERRAKEYPDFNDYLDGIVKGDDAQIQAYIEACLKVKNKYPKPQ